LLIDYPDILTAEERARMTLLKNQLTFGIISGLILIPFSAYMAYQARTNPLKRSSSLRKMVLFPVLNLGLVLYAASSANSLLS
jgi:hypothetical protein